MQFRFQDLSMDCWYRIISEKYAGAKTSFILKWMQGCSYKYDRQGNIKYLILINILGFFGKKISWLTLGKMGRNWNLD